MTTLPINEVFETVQGEGTWTGAPSIFVRLQFCPVGCPWCDTKHTWNLDPRNEITFDAMMAKTQDAPTYARVEQSELVWCLRQMKSRHVVLTGGEPCAYPLHDLTRALIDSRKTVQIETSGTFLIEVCGETWVTVSPKIGMPGKLNVRDDALWRADEIKMPVGKMADVDVLNDLLRKAMNAQMRDSAALTRRVYLQPLSQSPKATKVCIDAAREHGYRLSAQLHKYIGVR